MDEAKTKHRLILTYVCVIVGILFGVVAMILPPLGIINDSVLWFTGQLFIMSATFAGLTLPDIMRKKI